MNKNSAKSKVREEPTGDRTPRKVNISLLQPIASIGLMKESQKHLRFQISTQTASLQTLWGYFPDWMMKSLCPEAMETDSEIAKVKVR